LGGKDRVRGDGRGEGIRGRGNRIRGRESSEKERRRKESYQRLRKWTWAMPEPKKLEKKISFALGIKMWY
jgi:hypothetical protein